jgi:hypothetical protein
MSPQQQEVLKKRLKIAEAELKMRERNRNASEKGYQRVFKHIEELKRRLAKDGQEAPKRTE